MANPDPQALRDAAKSLRDQAGAARQVVVDQFRSQGTEHGAEYDRAKVQLDAATAEVKSREQVLKNDRDEATLARTRADEQHQKMVAAERVGDSAKAEEARESEAYNRAAADAATSNADAVERELTDARVQVAERQADFEHASQAVNQVMAQRGGAERQLDAMENKARMLDEAGLKLALAGTIDNPVERADMELAAEKLLRDAGTINVDTSVITAVTGQDVQIPDVNALPTVDPTATGATSPTGDTPASGDAPASGDTPATGDTGAGEAVPAGAGGSSDDGTSGAPTSDATTPAHLQDDFATVASGDGASGAAAAGATDVIAGDASAAGAPGADTLGSTPDLTAASDPLGMDTTAAPAADATAGFDSPAPAADGDAGTGFDAPADQPVAVADAMPDAGAAPADSFSDFSADPSADDASATVSDDADV